MEFTIVNWDNYAKELDQIISLILPEANLMTDSLE